MRVLVTGANGFVGRALLRLLFSQGHEVVAVSRAESKGCIAVGDICEYAAWSSLLQGCDVVIHLAARVHQMHDQASDPLAEFRRVNTGASLRLAREAKAVGVSRFIFISTVKVHGEGQGRPYRETDPFFPEDPYAISKVEAEKGLMAIGASGAMEVVILRPPLVYGAGVKGNFASMLQWVQRGIPLPLGAVENRRSLLALDNFVALIVLCADRKKSPLAANEAFLVSDGVDVSTPELLARIAHAFGKKSFLIPVPGRWLRVLARIVGRQGIYDRLTGSLTVDIAKSRHLLHWTPPVSMDEQLRKMADETIV